MRIACFVLALFSILAGQANAQSASYVGFKFYNDSNSGMPRTPAYSIAIDSSGFKWIGTKDFGLVKFDGLNWVVYDTTTSGIPDNHIWTVAVGPDNRIWLGTNSGGLVSFDGTNWQTYNQSNSSFPGGQVSALAPDDSGRVWVGGGIDGRYGFQFFGRFDGADFEFYTPPYTSDHFEGPGVVHAIALDSSNTVWLTTLSGLFKFDGVEFPQYSSYYKGPIAFDPEGNLWAGTNSKVGKLKDGAWVYTLGLPDNGVIANDAINIDKYGILWIGGPRLTQYTGDAWISYAVGGVNDINIDSENIKWGATSANGIFKYDDRPFIRLKSPNGGEIWETAKGKEITWNEGYISEYYDLLYSINNGATWKLLKANFEAERNSKYTYVYLSFPKIRGVSNHCRIKILDDRDSTVFDISDSTFTLFDLIEKPALSPTPGSYSEPQFVQLTASQDSVEIHYTVDGSEPTEDSPVYWEPINADSTLTIKARGYRPGWVASAITTGRYEIAGQVLTVRIDTQGTFLDTDYDGYETANLSASPSLISYGSIVEYLWTVDGDSVGNVVELAIDLPSGTHKVTLTLVSDRGVVESDSIHIHVYSASLNTGSAIFSGVSQLSDNVFFLGSPDNKIYRFDSTGVVNWTTLVGGEIKSSICVSGYNSIYVGSSDTRLYSYTHEGIPNWDKAMGGIILTSPSAGFDGSVYVGTNTGRLFALSQDSDILWGFQADDAIISSPAISLKNNIFFGSCAGTVYGLSSEGAELWSYTTGDSIISSPALSRDGTLIIASKDGFLYKILEDGEVVWSERLNGAIRASPVIDADGNIYIGTSTGFVYNISAEGSENWRRNVGNAISITAAIAKNGMVYLGCQDGRVLALTAGGELKWFLQTGGPIVSAPLVTDTGTIYFGSSDGKVYIVKEPSFVGSTMTQQFSQWPTFKGNNRRTGYIGDVIGDVAQPSDTPTEFKAFENYPNPFNASTKISYHLPNTLHVKLTIYNIKGQLIRVLTDESQKTGVYLTEWDGLDSRGLQVASGVYLYSLRAGPFNKVGKILLLR